MNIRPLLVAAAVAAATTLSTAALAEDAKPYLTVNGKAVPKAYADVLLGGRQADENAEKALREELIRREVLVQEALLNGVDKKPDVQAQIQTQTEMTRQNVLIGAYLQDYVKTHPVTEDMVRKEYDTIIASVGDKEYKARHILVDTEEEAKAIIAKLKKGARFEELAKQSKDPSSQKRGGELDWANKATFVPSFTEALVALKKGKFTETPVKSDYGYHIIRLDDVRDLKVPPFDAVKERIAQGLQKQIVDQRVAELRSAAKVE